MDREAMEFDHDELTDLEYLLHLLQLSHGSRSSVPSSVATRPPRTPTLLELSHGFGSSAPSSAATRPPRTPTRTLSRPSRLSRTYPPPASAPVGLLPPWGLQAPGLERLIDVAAMDVYHDQPPEGRRDQEQQLWTWPWPCEVKLMSEYWVWSEYWGWVLLYPLPPWGFKPRE